MTIDAPALDRPLPGASMGQAIARFYRNYAVFFGRASRSEYWWVVLFFALVYAGLYGILLIVVLSVPMDQAGTEGTIIGFSVVAGIVFVGSLVPSIAVQVRRLHDANLSGFFYFLNAAPYIGGLVVLVMTIIPSNAFGSRFDRGADRIVVPEVDGSDGLQPEGRPD
jgi:uncharacterized membrane protein YhaH (DUF805 family)